MLNILRSMSRCVGSEMYAQYPYLSNGVASHRIALSRFVSGKCISGFIMQPCFERRIQFRFTRVSFKTHPCFRLSENQRSCTESEVISLFGTTYLCELLFSRMKNIKLGTHQGYYMARFAQLKRNPQCIMSLNGSSADLQCPYMGLI